MRAGKFLLLVTLVLGGCGQSTSPNPAASTPTVAVSVVNPVRGSLTATITAYGSAGPSPSGAQTISIPQPGQVVGLMVVPGMPVRTGQPLVTFSVAPTARSTYLQAVAALAAAEKQRVNTAQLLSQQLATTDQLAQADKAVSDAHATLSALRAEGASQAVQTLSAPFDGVVTAISVAQGDRTQPGAALVTLARSSGIVVTVGVEPDRRSDVAIGQPAKLQRLSGGNVVAGRVVRAASALNPRTRMVDVDLSVPAGLLLPGEAMQVVIETGQIQGWIVPHRAVVTANGPSKIFQVAGNKAKSIPVRVLLSSGKDDVVDGAVNRRQPIIVDGAYQVHNGGAIRFGR